MVLPGRKSDTELARVQGVSRAAIHARRRRGWTEDEIQAGQRLDAEGGPLQGSRRYQEQLGGLTVAEAAKLYRLRPATVYYRLANGLPLGEDED